jgi:tetratricopeptide (TPR) repeat protein
MMHRTVLLAKAGLVAMTIAAAGSLTLAGMTASSFAASSGGGSSGGSSGGTQCKSGMKWNAAKGICEQSSSSLSDDEILYEQGRTLALAGEYGNALALFDRIEDKHDADVLTMIGYSKRKSGAVEDGIGYYHQALAIDPNNVNTREYLGEGYVAMGRLDLAQTELDKIGAICGQSCEQYIELASVMAGNADWN